MRRIRAIQNLKLIHVFSIRKRFMIYVFELIINVNIAQPPTEYHVILKRYK